MDKKEKQALGHKAMNLYQIEMLHLEQSSQLISELLPETDNPKNSKTQIFVEKENFLERLQKLPITKKVGLMDFADPAKLGHDFMTEGNFREQMICRNSFLYPELRKYRQSYYYKNKLASKNGYYSDALIYAKNIKFLRGPKEDKILPTARYADVAVIAAPHVKLISEQTNHLPAKTQLENVFRRRITQTLRAFKQAKVNILILGAFGCEMFGNDPKMVAPLFKHCLEKPEFQGFFEQIYFDIFTNNVALQAFKDVFNE